MPIQRWKVTDNIEEITNNIKFKSKAKFADKILVWWAISPAGVLAPFIGRVRGETVKIQRCLPKLLHFIREHHNNDYVIFW